MIHRPFPYRRLKLMRPRGFDEVQRYLNQQDDLMRNVQNIKNVVILKEMLEGFKQQIAMVTKKNQAEALKWNSTILVVPF